MQLEVMAHDIVAALRNESDSAQVLDLLAEIAEQYGSDGDFAAFREAHSGSLSHCNIAPFFEELAAELRKAEAAMDKEAF